MITTETTGRFNLKGIEWQTKQGRWAHPATVNRNTGRIGNQMRGIAPAGDCLIGYSFAEPVALVLPDGTAYVTTRRFPLPDAILAARDAARNRYAPHRNTPTYSMTTETHKQWFARELGAQAVDHRAFMTLLDRAVGTAPEHDYGRASRYDG